MGRWVAPFSNTFLAAEQAAPEALLLGLGFLDAVLQPAGAIGDGARGPARGLLGLAGGLGRGLLDGLDGSIDLVADRGALVVVLRRFGVPVRTGRALDLFLEISEEGVLHIVVPHRNIQLPL